MKDGLGFEETNVHLESGTYTRDTASYTGIFRIGNLTTSAGSTATITFVQPFGVGSYAIFFSPAAVAGWSTGSLSAVTSGALRASGCEVIGEPSKSFNWIAIRLPL